MMFQTIATPVRNATYLLRSVTRLFSSNFPIIEPRSKSATKEAIDAAKALFSPQTTIPRSRGTNPRLYPSYRSLPTSATNERKPTSSPDGKTLYPSKQRFDTGVSPDDMPFLHHHSHDDKPKPKFKNPRKRASKILNELQMEAVAKSKESKPEVWEVPFKVGDAVELQVLDSGGVDNPQNKKLDKIRGVVLGRENKGLDTAIYLKDVLFGEHVERKVKLHSPMVKTLKVLEEGFVNKGKKKGRRVKRAKLYYLRDMKPEGECQVLALSACSSHENFLNKQLSYFFVCIAFIVTRVTPIQK